MSATNVAVGVVLFTTAIAPVHRASAGQQRTAPPTTAAAEVTSCAQAHMVVDQLLAVAMARMDAARQSNAAAELRAAVDSLQNTMRDARAQLAPCALTQLAAPTDHSKMPMGSSPAAKPETPAAPTDHSTMAMGKPAETAAQAVDPVCGLKVDPTSAPQAAHEGRAYSFCSEQHRQLFQKTPTKYLPKKK